MVRFSSIIKKTPETDSLPPQPAISPSDTTKDEVSDEERVARVQEIYRDMLAFVRSVADRLGRGEAIAYTEIRKKVESLAGEFKRNMEPFASLIKTETPDNYIIAHQVNVCFLALKMGIQMGYDQDKLVELGSAALLFDIGMLKVLDIVKQRRPLIENEIDEVKKHPGYGVEMLKLVTNLPPAVVDVAMQHHERLDGKGYPRGLKGREITDLARLISLADVYIALIHPRSQRRGLTSHDAVKELLSSSALFSSNALKCLLTIISVYPVGTWVELNSHDVGKVIRLNPGQPLRPVLELVCDHHGRMMETKKIMNLTENPQLFITAVVENENIDKWGLANR